MTLTLAAAIDDPVQALRAATHELHARLDAGLPLARPDATLADYALHLCVLRDWQMALAPWLSRTGDDRQSLELMAQDLRDCGPLASAPSPETFDLRPVRSRDDGSDAFCWGIRYVLEGSALGGQVLYKRIREPLAPHPLRYLSQRPAVAPRWPETLQVLRRELGGEAQTRAGCDGAASAFELLLAGFRETGSL